MIGFGSCVGTVLALSAMLNAQTVPGVNGATLSASVSEVGNTYVYAYEVANSGVSTGAIARLHLDISQPQGGVTFDGAGLPTGQGFASNIAALNTADPNTTPLVTSTADAPDGWVVGTSMNGTMIWGAATIDAAIPPGQSQSGFSLYSKGTPAIRSFSAEPELDVDSLSLTEPTPETLPDYVRALLQIRNQARTTGVTIAPSAPPVAFQPVQFLQTIQTYKEQALKQGWITNQGVANSLDAKLNAALAALQAQDSKTAKNILNALLNEVEAQNNKHLTPEAVALLQFNTQYLISKLP
jgi:hypothetical protein